MTTRRWSDTFTEDQQPGRFERDFDEIEEVGSGEFGKVIKVHSKGVANGEMYAIKKSKRFEGVKHRCVDFYWTFLVLFIIWGVRLRTAVY